MYKTGVFAGKFMPPHRGHLSAIINSATQCETLYVVVSDNKTMTERMCKESGLPVMDGLTRTKWLSQELQGFEHIKVLLLDESDIPEYPLGWAQWSSALKCLIRKNIDVLFGGDKEYKEVNDIWFPHSDYVLFDYKRERYSVSASLIRENPFKYWDYILGSARPFFAKKVLITGTESCGKTTITKYLAKIFHTSWSEEVGRDYSKNYLGGNESVFTMEDFGRIAYMQYEADMDALRKANKIVFYDTDAVVTQYYSELYLGGLSERVESFVDSTRYDKVLIFTPSVKWVADGLRWNKDQKTRNDLHSRLFTMYVWRGFKNKIIEIDGDYRQRLEEAISISKELIGEQ
jgi:HTH-type transcriptional repressor of NAD biosynthesis genes